MFDDLFRAGLDLACVVTLVGLDLNRQPAALRIAFNPAALHQHRAPLTSHRGSQLCSTVHVQQQRDAALLQACQKVICGHRFAPEFPFHVLDSPLLGRLAERLSGLSPRQKERQDAQHERFQHGTDRVAEPARYRTPEFDTKCCKWLI